MFSVVYLKMRYYMGFHNGWDVYTYGTFDDYTHAFDLYNQLRATGGKCTIVTPGIIRYVFDVKGSREPLDVVMGDSTSVRYSTELDNLYALNPHDIIAEFGKTLLYASRH